VTVALEILVRTGVLPSFLVPAPSEVILSLGPGSARIWEALLETTVNAALGLAVALTLGVGAGVALSLSPTIQRIFYPYAVFFQTVPIIAIAPLLVIWFGYGAPTIIASAAIVSVFPVVASTLSGLLSTDPALLDLFKISKATRLQRLFKLRLPFALPSLFTGARIAAGLAVVGAIVGEFIAGGGLGGIIDESRTQQRIDRVFAAVLLASGLGFVFFSFFNFLSRRLLRNWHASERS
jgi:NitT/TauT family transport system permease protein